MTSIFPNILTTPRLTLTQFSPDSLIDAHYATIILPHITTISQFEEFRIERAPTPWATHAIVYLLRLQQRDISDDVISQQEQPQLHSDEPSHIEDEVIGHVSVAHSLRDRQPRIKAADMVSVVSGSTTAETDLASAILQTATVPDIGWRIRPAHQRCGYASEAAQRLVRFLCVDEEGPKFRTLCCFADQANLGSRGVAKRVGMVDVVVDFGSGMANRRSEEQDRDGSPGSKVLCDDEETTGVIKDEHSSAHTKIGKAYSSSTETYTGKVLTCPHVAKGIWFGILGDGWTWQEGRPRQTALEKSVAGLFEAMGSGFGVRP